MSKVLPLIMQKTYDVNRVNVIKLLNRNDGAKAVALLKDNGIPVDCYSYVAEAFYQEEADFMLRLYFEDRADDIVEKIVYDNVDKLTDTMLNSDVLNSGEDLQWVTEAYISKNITDEESRYHA